MKSIFYALLAFGALCAVLPENASAAEKQKILCEQGQAKTDALGRVQQPMGCDVYKPPKGPVEKPPFYGLCRTDFRYGKDGDRSMFSSYKGAGINCAAGFRIGEMFSLAPGVELNYAPRMGEFSVYRVFDTRDDLVRGYNLHENQTVFTPWLTAELVGKSWLASVGLGVGLDTEEGFGYDELSIDWLGEIKPVDFLRLGLEGRYETATDEVDVYAHRAKALLAPTEHLWLGAGLDSQVYNEKPDHIETVHSFGGSFLVEYEVVKYLMLHGEIGTSQSSKLTTGVGARFALGR